MNPVLIMTIVFFILIAIRVPIAFSLGIASLFYMVIVPGAGGISIPVLVNRMMVGVYSYAFLAIPFFILAGRLMNSAGITERIFDFAEKLVGHIKGGLGHVNIIASIIFSGMSGAAAADAAGLGLIEIKAMKDAGYPADFAACITAASSTIGPIIPPSITMVLYGVLTGASIGRLFIGGIIPGILMGGSLMILVYVYAVRSPQDFPVTPKPTKNEAWVSFKRAFLPLWAPIIILGGIAWGWVTPTESGVLAVVYSIILAIVYRELHLNEFKAIFIDSAKQVGAVMLVLAGARAFSHVMTIENIPTLVSGMIGNFTDSGIVVLLMVNVILLILGMFMNSSTILILTLPILQPLLMSYGVDMVHFGVVMTLNVMIGMITPPLGVVLYITSDIAEVPFEKAVRSILPFYIPLVTVLMLITYIPGLVLWLPNLLMG